MLVNNAAKPGPADERLPQQSLLDALMACPNGVMRRSDAMPGVTETSTNLGVIKTQDGEVYVQCLIRPLTDSSAARASSR